MSRALAGELVSALTTATDGEALDCELLARLKAAVRSDDEELREAFGALLQRLHADDARSRLRALALANWLFTRSKLFRVLLAPALPEVLALTQGTERALPGPRAAAERLRQRSSELLGAWAALHGSHYPQLRVAQQAHASLHERQAQVADAERPLREARTQELLRQRYRALAPGLPALFEDARASLSRLDAAVGLLCSSGAAGSLPDEADWEDVPPVGAPAASVATQAAHDDVDRAATCVVAVRDALLDVRATHAPAVERAVALLSRLSGADAARTDALREALALKAAAQTAAQRCAALLPAHCAPLVPARPQPRPPSRVSAAPRLELVPAGSLVAEVRRAAAAIALPLQAQAHATQRARDAAHNTAALARLGVEVPVPHAGRGAKREPNARERISRKLQRR